LRLFSFGGYGLALAALALVIFGAYDSYPSEVPPFVAMLSGATATFKPDVAYSSTTADK